jgi:two-component system, NarL family, response regulator YdfI
MAQKNGAGGGIRVVVAAISAVRRGGLESIVRKDSSLRLSGSASSLLGIDARLRDLQPDVLMADLPNPEPQFLVAAASWEQAGCGVVALIDDPPTVWAGHALRSGVRAILPRDSSAPEIHSAIHAAVKGLVLLDGDLARELGTLRRPANSEPGAEAFEELTDREVDVLRLLAEGLGNKEVASRLGISDHTVKFHISSILSKLGAGSRTEAVTIGIRMGLILL